MKLNKVFSPLVTIPRYTSTSTSSVSPLGMIRRLVITLMFLLNIFYAISFCQENYVIEEDQTTQELNYENKNESPKTTSNNFKLHNFLFGPAIAIYHSHDNVYKEIHQQETLTPMLQLQANISKHFALWSDFGFLYNDGYIKEASQLSHDPKARIYHILFGLGVKAQYFFDNYSNIFLKAGPSLIYFNFKHRLPLIDQSISKTTFGLTLGTGIQAQIKNNWYTTIFADYMFNKTKFKHPTSSQKIDAGGFLTGLALQYKF